MSKFYGQVQGMAQTIATRRGGRDITASVQSWNGSIITRLYYDREVLSVDVRVSEDSTFYGRTIFSGTFAEFIKRLEG